MVRPEELQLRNRLNRLRKSVTGDKKKDQKVLQQIKKVNKELQNLTGKQTNDKSLDKNTQTVPKKTVKKKSVNKKRK